MLKVTEPLNKGETLLNNVRLLKLTMGVKQLYNFLIITRDEKRGSNIETIKTVISVTEKS